jgi:hypothetical protein
MRHRDPWLAAALVIAVLLLSACAQGTSAVGDTEPVQVKAGNGANLARLTLTEQAVRRLDIKTAPTGTSGRQKVVPYSAVLYDKDGDTWAYTNPEPQVFVRAPIVVDRVEGASAYLSQGPPAGTAVVTVGAAELFGAEFGVGE